MAGLTTITASNIQNGAGKKLALGRISFTPVDAQGLPFSPMAGGDMPGIVTSTAIDMFVVNGAITTRTDGGTAELEDVSLTNPRYFAYMANITDAAGRQVGFFPAVQPTGGSYSLDTMVPYYGNNVSYVQGLAGQKGDPGQWGGAFPNAYIVANAHPDNSLNPANGALYPNVGYTTTDFIVIGPSRYTLIQSSGFVGLIYYDSSGNIVSYPTTQPYLVKAPATAVTLRVCVTSSSAPDLAIRTDLGTSTFARPTPFKLDVGETILLDHEFKGTALPSGWTPNDSTAWDVANALVPPNNANGLFMKLQSIFAVTKRRHRIQFTVWKTGNIGLGALQDSVDNGGGVMSVAVVDPNNLYIYGNPNYTGNDAGYPIVTVALTKPMAAGHTYTLSIQIVEREFTATFVDDLTGDTTVATTGNNSTNDGTCVPTGIICDWPMIYISGTAQVIVNRFAITSLRSRPRLLGMGDSIMWGVNANVYTRYMNILGAQADANFVVSARGGATSTGMLARFTTELPYLRPDFVIMCIGANDAQLGVSASAWTANVQAAVNAAVAGGAQVILCTCIPFAGNPSAQTAINSYNAAAIGGSITGILKLVQWHIPMSTGDGTVGNSSLYSSDGVHPNSAGHQVMANKLLSDCPYLAPTTLFVSRGGTI